MYGQTQLQLNNPKVVATLVHLLFANCALHWDHPTDHVELFAGKCEVTKAEIKVDRNFEPFSSVGFHDGKKDLMRFL